MPPLNSTIIPAIKTAIKYVTPLKQNVENKEGLVFLAYELYRELLQTASTMDTSKSI